jgi:hypothetical protein
MQNLTIAELDAQSVELLPAKETLYWGDWAGVYATNTSVALNAAAFGSAAYSAAVQTIVISQ